MQDKTKIYRGTTLFPAHRPILGRIRFGASTHGRSEAILRVCDRLPLEEGEDPVGLLWTAERTPSVFGGLPMLALYSLSPSEEGKLALLDTERGQLTVCPDWEALTQYAGLLAKEEPPLERPLPRLSSLGMFAGEGCLLRGDEELQHLSPQQLLDIERITVLIDGKEGLSDAVRRLYLLGVFGGFSLLFRGILTENDRKHVLEACHRCFCELTAEGREFNGYLPKGILLDTPLSLNLKGTLSGVDMLCFDYDTLCLRLGGTNTKQVRRLTEQHIEAFAKQHPQAAKSIILRSLPDRETLSLVKRLAFEELFLPTDIIDLTRSLLAWI